MIFALGTLEGMTALPNASTRLSPGQQLGAFTLETLAHGRRELPNGSLIHLQFRRFAGCPICNLHLRSFSREIGKLKAAKIETIAFFHSSEETMRPLHGELPFPVVADLERRWYARFGVEQSKTASLHPGAMWSAMRGVVTTKANLKGEGGSNGLPADFLIDGKGVVIAAHYGSHADDSWSVDDVIAELGERRPTP